MILVTGATGLVGAHLLLSLARKHNKLVALYRSKQKKSAVLALFSKNDADHPKLYNRIVWLKAELNDLYQLEKAFKGITQVFHCAALVSLFYYHKEKLLKVNVEGTANIVNFALKNRLEKMIYVSSIAALGESKHSGIIDENSSWNLNAEYTPYAVSKFNAEMEVWRGIQEGLCAVILNPGVVLSATLWNRSSGKILDKIAKGLNFYPTGNIAFVSVEDVVKVSLIAHETNILDQNRFVLVAKNLPYQSFIAQLAKGFGKKSPKYPLKKSYLFLTMVIESLLHSLKIHRRQLSKGLIDAFCSSTKYDGSKIEKVTTFKYEPSKRVFERLIRVVKD